MTLSNLILIPIATVVVVVVVILGAALLNRGKQLKCPNCGQVFKAPAMDEKLSGLGLTLPYLGNVNCPHCGTKRSRRDYEKVEQPRGTTTSESLKGT